MDMERDLRRMAKQLSIVVAVVLLLFLLGLSAYIAWINYQDLHPAGFVQPPARTTPLTHDLAITIIAQSFDPNTGVLQYFLSIRAWLPPSTTEMWVRVFNGNNTMYFDLKATGNQGTGQQVFLQMDSNSSMPYHYLVKGLSQRSPYDEYNLFFLMEFGTFDNTTFPGNFTPNITFYAPRGWGADVVEDVTNMGTQMTVTANITLYREAVNSFQFFIPPLVIYAVLGASLYIPKSSTKEGKITSLQRRSVIYLNMVIASFTLATLFVPGFVTATPALFLQATYMALLVGALLLQAFAILDAYSGGADSFSFWDYSALSLASVMPVIFELAYSFLAILPSSSNLSGYGPLGVFGLGLHFLDYRIALWSVVFFVLLWIRFFHVNNILELPFTTAGLGILLILALGGLPGDLSLLVISFLYLGIGAVLFAIRLAVSKYYLLFVSAFVVVQSVLIFAVPQFLYSPLGLSSVTSFFLTELSIIGVALLFSKHQRIRLGFTMKKSKPAILFLVSFQLIVIVVAGIQNFSALVFVENVLVGVAEELSFRGYVQGALGNAFGIDVSYSSVLTKKLHWAQILRFMLLLIMASLIFALYHVPIDLQTGGTPLLGALGTQFIFGFAMSVAYLAGNNLFPLMLIHGFWDYDLSYPISSVAELALFILLGIIVLPVLMIIIPTTVKALKEQICK